MKISQQYKFQALTVLALLASTNSCSANSFDDTINRLLIPSIFVNSDTYKNVVATVDSYTLLGVDNGLPGPDTFDPNSNLLKMGSVVFQGAIYTNVRIQLNAFTLLAATLLPPSTPVAPAPPATPTLAPLGGALTAANTCNLSNFQTDLITLINQARASSRTCGSTVYPAVAAVAWNSQLFDAAVGHSADMANQNYFDHTSKDGRTPGQRMSAAGYNWSAYGENIAAGQTSASSVMAGWMESAGHCSNIMNKNFKDVAVACVINNSSNYKRYWTMNLAR